MEAQVLIPLIAGLTGAIIGALSSILTIWIQQNAQSKRDKIKLASEMAKDDQKFIYEAFKEQGLKGNLMPVSVFQHFHFEVLTALENGTLDEEKIIQIKANNDRLIAKFTELQSK